MRDQSRKSGAKDPAIRPISPLTDVLHQADAAQMPVRCLAAYVNEARQGVVEKYPLYEWEPKQTVAIGPSRETIHQIITLYVGGG